MNHSGNSSSMQGLEGSLQEKEVNWFTKLCQKEWIISNKVQLYDAPVSFCTSLLSSASL